MSRIRTIKPEFGHDEALSSLPAEVHLFAGLLLTHADDAGYFNAHPKLLHAAVCPLRELSVTIPEILRSLHGIGYIELHQGSDGRQYGKITNFLKHQRISHPSPSKIAPLLETFRNPPETLRPEVEGEVEGEVELGSGGGSESAPAYDFHYLQHAQKLLEVIGLPQTGPNIKTAGEAIRSESKYTGTSMEDVCSMLADKIRQHRDEGIPIDKFYFEDAKWRRTNGKQPVSAAAARSERSKQAIIDGLTAHARRGDPPIDVGLQVGAAKRISG